MGVSELLERVEYRAACWLVRRAPRVVRFIPRRGRYTVEGQSVHPELQLVLAVRELTGARQLRAEGLASARARARRDARVYEERWVQVPRVRSLVLDGAAGPLRGRLYTPGDRGPHPLLVFFHGGGHVLGDLDTHDAPCRTLCAYAGVQVLSVDYRLAPEHPFPAAIEDAVHAFRWARAHAPALGADPAQIALGGDSAGGNMAAVACQLLAGERSPPCLQLLIYPSTDRSIVRRSRALFAEGFLLTSADIDWYLLQYVGADPDLRDPRISPLLAPDLARLPPAVVVTAGFDPLRDEGDAYAQALRAAGVRTAHLPFPDLIHGFINMGGVSPRAQSALVDIARATRALLGTR